MNEFLDFNDDDLLASVVSGMNSYLWRQLDLYTRESLKSKESGIIFVTTNFLKNPLTETNGCLKESNKIEENSCNNNA